MLSRDKMVSFGSFRRATRIMHSHFAEYGNLQRGLPYYPPHSPLCTLRCAPSLIRLSLSCIMGTNTAVSSQASTLTLSAYLTWALNSAESRHRYASNDNGLPHVPAPRGRRRLRERLWRQRAAAAVTRKCTATEAEDLDARRWQYRSRAAPEPNIGRFPPSHALHARRSP